MKNRERILFVDDEESITSVAEEYFQYLGYEVFTASNGVDAVNILQNESIDCCFTDINMPEMDGLELAEKIRLKDNTIPVIIMTAYPTIDNTIRTLKNGVVDFLIKPVKMEHMEICLKRVLRERRLFTENILLKKEVEGKERLERLNQELGYKVDELNILNRIMSDFSATRSTSDVFKRAVEITLEIARADESRFYILNEAVKHPFEIAASFSGNKPPVIGRQGSPPQKNPAGLENAPLGQLIDEVMSDGLPMLISENNGMRGLPETIGSAMVVPFKIRKKVFGLLTAIACSDGTRFTEKDLYYLSFMIQNAAHAIENLALYENIYENLFATLYAFVRAIEARDPYTQQHSNRVTAIAITIGEAMECTPEEIDILNTAGHLHDIGKIGIRDDILLKPDRLTNEEYNLIKEHPDIGAGIVEQLGLWSREQEIIRSHHEWFDGTGYPRGLEKEDIPLLARILSVADVYDALASDRAYRKKMPEEKVLGIIEEGAGRQFDKKVVDLFLELHREGKISEFSQVGQATV